MHRRLILTPPRMLWATTIDVLRNRRPLASFDPMLVVAPTRTTARRLIAAAAEPHGACAGLVPSTWHDLARDLATPGEGTSLLPAGADVLVVGDIVQRSPGPWGDLATQPGFHRSLAATVRDLADSGALELSSPPAPPEVAAVFAAYQRHLDHHKLIDDARLYRLAAQSARSQPPPWSTIVVHAVYDLTGVQMELVRALGANTSVDVVWIAPDPDLDGGRFAAPLVHSLVRSLGLTMHRPAASPPTGPAVVAARLDGTQPTDGAVEADLSVLACPGARSQRAEVTRSILAAAADGVPWRDMVVVSPSAETLPELARHLESCGVPTAAEPAQSLADDPIGRAVTGLLDIVDGHTDRRTVIRVLSAAPLRTDRVGSRAQPSCWDLLTRRAGCTGGDRSSWRRCLDSARLELERQAQAARANPAHGSAEDYEGWSRARPAATLEAEARQLRVLAGVVDDLLENAERCARRAQDRSWSEVVTAISDLFEQWLEATATVDAIRTAIVSLAALDRVGVAPERVTLRRLIAEALDAAAAPECAQREGHEHRPGSAVLLTSWQGARGLEVRAGWLVDLGSGTFPPATRQDPILPDTARRQITSATGCPLPLKLERSAEAELQLRLGLAVASERLTLTYVRSDPLTGRALLPAHGVLECVHQAEGRHLGYAQIDASRFVHWLGDRPPEMKAADRRPLLTAAEYDLAAALTDPTGAGAHLLLDHGWRRQLRCDRARYGDSQLTAWDGLVARTPRTGTVWVTTLEELATCPFRFFLGTVLGLIPAPDPEDEFQPDRREVGTIAHSVVESVLQSWQRADGTLPEALDPAMVSEVSEEVHAQISLREDGLGGGSRALWAAVADELARHLTEGLRRELHVIAANGWRPRAEEVAHEATITFADVALRLGGRADRVDADTSGRLVITDYKYSRGPRARVLLDGGQRLQLPFYARLMASRFGAQIEAARYAYLRADAHRPQRSLTIDELEQLAPQLAELTAELVSIAQEGTLFQYPESDRSRCEGCDYWELCGPGVRAVFRRKHTTDPRLQQHASLKSRFP